LTFVGVEHPVEPDRARQDVDLDDDVRPAEVPQLAVQELEGGRPRRFERGPLRAAMEAGAVVEWPDGEGER
jgi:hypothetical protein